MSSGEVYELFVGSQVVDCVGVGPMKCLRTRRSESEEWTNFYDKIMGFEHVEGHNYKLKIEKTERENVPADASKYVYKLFEVLEDQLSFFLSNKL